MRVRYFLGFLACLASTGFARTVVYVDASAPPGGDGLSWGSAYRELSDALAAASVVAPAQVWVAAGTYFPDPARADRSRAFSVAWGVSVYGGFAGGESTLDARNPDPSRTVLTGNIGLLNTTDDNSWHVVVVPASAGSSVVLDGFTIRGGNANGSGSLQDSGGGVLVDGASPVIRNCVMVSNLAKYGGGLYSRGGTPTLEFCAFSQNVASADGGGLNVNGTIHVLGCAFDGNRSNFGGGAVLCCGSSLVEDSTFTGNFSSTGGGLFSPVGTLALVRCKFEGNSGGTGGAVHSSSSGSTFSAASCTFTGNTANQGGAVYLTNSPLLFQCVMSRNTSIQRGAGLYLQGAAKITNCNVYSNWSLTQGGGIYAASGVPVISNTVLWSNADSQSSLQASQLSGASGVWTINYSCVQGWTGSIPGVGNTAGAPTFAEPVGPDRRLGTADDTFLLLPGSSCIDAGDPLLVPPDVWDLDGDGNVTERAPLDIALGSRIVDDPETADTGAGPAPVVDIGAYEHQAVCSADFDGSGFVDVDDYTAFIAAFEAGSNSADYDGSGFVDIDDFDAFVSDFANGC